VLPIVKRDSLLNGLQILVLEQPGTGAVRAHLRINSGSMFDLAGKGGLADITAGMLLKGGGGLSARNVSDTVEQLGLKVSIVVGWDSTDIIISGPADTLSSMFDLLGRLVITPAFDQKEFDALKSQRVTDLKAAAADDQEAVRRKALETVFGPHPFGRPFYGTDESLAQVARQDLVFYHGRYYLANNSGLVVSGDATAEQVTQLARAKLGAWKKGDKIPATFRPPDPVTTRRIILLDRPQAATAHAAIAQMAFSRRAEDYFAAAVMSDLLAQANARLAASAAGATVETKIEPRLIPGVAMVEIKSPADEAATRVSTALESMSRLQSGQPSVEEVEAAKSRIISSMAERLRTNEGTAGVILDIELYGLGRDYLINFADRLNRVTPADVQRAAQTYLRPQTAVAVIAAPAGRIEEPLKRLGNVTVIK
jgi:zinc protease